MCARRKILNFLNFSLIFFCFGRLLVEKNMFKQTDNRTELAELVKRRAEIQVKKYYCQKFYA